MSCQQSTDLMIIGVVALLGIVVYALVEEAFEEGSIRCSGERNEEHKGSSVDHRGVNGSGAVCFVGLLFVA